LLDLELKLIRKTDKSNSIFPFLTIADPNVKAILVNVFGGIVNCATVANGVVAAVKNVGLKVPLVVRLEGIDFTSIYYRSRFQLQRYIGFDGLLYDIGTNVDNAKQILKDSGLQITSAENLDDAAKKAVACLS
jgi:succinyl-CoA synthetase beta subunit